MPSNFNLQDFLANAADAIQNLLNVTDINVDSLVEQFRTGDLESLVSSLAKQSSNAVDSITNAIYPVYDGAVRATIPVRMSLSTNCTDLLQTISSSKVFKAVLRQAVAVGVNADTDKVNVTQVGTRFKHFAHRILTELGND